MNIDFDQAMPPGWVLARFAEIASYIQRGKSPKYTELSELPVVNQKAIRWDGLRKEHLKYIHPEQWKSWERVRFLRDLDILWNSTGTGTLGRACLYRASYLPQAVVDSHVTIIRLYKDHVAPEYVFYFIMSPYVQRRMDELQAGSTNQVELSRTAVNELNIPLAPLAEQQRVASKIEELFSDIEQGEAALRKVQQLLSAYRQSVLKAALLGEITNADYGGWEGCKVGDLLADIRYGTAKKCTPDPSKTPVLRIPNVVSGKIDLSDLKHTDFTEQELRSLSLREGDLLLVRSNGSASLVARSAVVGKEACGYAYAGYLIRLRVKQDKVLPHFLHLYFHSPLARAIIERQARSTSGVHNINSDEIKSLKLRLPDPAEQQEIVDKVQEIFSRIDALEVWCRTELARSNTLRQSILKAAFSGQLVPQDPTDEPASVLLSRIREPRVTPRNNVDINVDMSRAEQLTLWESA